MNFVSKSICLLCGPLILLGLASCSKPAKVHYRATAIKDSVVYLEVEDWTTYRNLYPAEALEGGMLLQKLNLEKVDEAMPGSATAMESLSLISQRFSGVIVLSAELPESFETGEPSINLVADFDGEAADLEAVLSEVGEAKAPVDGETYGAFAFRSMELASDFTVHYAVTKGVLIASNDLSVAHRSVDVLAGTALAASISDSPVYQKARALSKGIEGGFALVQFTDQAKAEAKKAASKNSKDAEAAAEMVRNMESFGIDEVEGIFISYPRGAEAMQHAMAGFMIREKTGIFALYEKPAGDLILPKWIAPETYFSTVFQLDLANFKDALVAFASQQNPNAEAEYQKANHGAYLAIGVTLDDLLAKGFGDQVTVAVDLDAEVFEAMFSGRTNPAAQMGMTGGLAIQVRDRAVVMGVLEKLVEQSRGMVKPEEFDGAYYLSSPVPMPNVPPGTMVSLALTEDTLFVKWGQAGALKAALTLAKNGGPTVFQSLSFERAYPGLESTAVAAMVINYRKIWQGMRKGTFEANDLSDAETAQLQAYFDFIESIADSIGIVVTEVEGAYLMNFGISGK